MLMDAWRKYAMSFSGACEKLGQVPVYAEVDGKLVKVIDVTTTDDGKIILKTTNE
jgi:hypothetical protein